MKHTKIRSNIWETNSSSTHVISIANNKKEFVMDFIIPNNDGVIKLSGGSFGWEWEKYNDALTKANYIATAVKSVNDKKLLKNVIQTQTGAVDVIIKLDEDAYIDHQSYDTYSDVIKSAELLRQFIFNKNSWLFTGNDNTSQLKSFYDLPEYKGDEIIHPVYEYRLRIDGFDNLIFFKTNPNKNQIIDELCSLLNYVILNEDGHFCYETYSYEKNEYKFKSYVREPDYQNQIIYFIRNAYYDAIKEYDKIYNKLYPGINVDNVDNKASVIDEIERGLINQPYSPYVKGVKYFIEKI